MSYSELTSYKGLDNDKPEYSHDRSQNQMLIGNEYQNHTSDQGLHKVIPTELRKQLWAMHFRNENVDLLELLENIIPLCIEDSEFLFLAGVSSRKLKDFKKSMGYFKQALAIEPENFAVNFEVGRLFYDSELYDLAEKTFLHCVDLDPEQFLSFYERAKSLCELERYAEALQVITQALAMQPDHPGANERLAVCYIKLAEFKKGHEVLNRMLANGQKMGTEVGSTDSFKQLVHAHKLTTCLELSLHDEIEHSILETEKFVKHFSDNIELSGDARLHLSLAYLRLGRTENGWKHYFYRFNQPKFPTPQRLFNKPRLAQLSDLTGKKILIWKEQGVGDEIEFCGLLNEFIKRTNANAILEVDERLVKSLQRSFPHTVVRSPQYDTNTMLSTCEDFDLHMPMADIYTFIEPSISSSVMVKPWFAINKDKSKEWEQVLKRENLRIGFAFGSHFSNAKRDKHKHLNFEFFAKLIENSPHTWVNLDYTWDNESLSETQKIYEDKIFFPNVDLKNDFEEVGAILNNCDLLISPYMAIRSLAGAIGIPSVSFVRGALYHFDLGAALLGKSEFKSPLIYNSVSIQIADDVSDENFERIFLNFCNREIHNLIERKIQNAG